MLVSEVSDTLGNMRSLPWVLNSSKNHPGCPLPQWWFCHYFWSPLRVINVNIRYHKLSLPAILRKFPVIAWFIAPSHWFWLWRTHAWIKMAPGSADHRHHWFALHAIHVIHTIPCMVFPLSQTTHKHVYHLFSPKGNHNFVFSSPRKYRQLSKSITWCPHSCSVYYCLLCRSLDICRLQRTANKIPIWHEWHVSHHLLFSKKINWHISGEKILRRIKLNYLLHKLLNKVRLTLGFLKVLCFSLLVSRAPLISLHSNDFFTLCT